MVLLRLLKLLGEKLQQSWEDSNDPIKSNPVVQSNFSTVAVIAISPNIPTTVTPLKLFILSNCLLEFFCAELENDLSGKLKVEMDK